MSNLGFIKLPRALLQDPIWKDLPATYRIVFITILENMCFSECKQNDHGTIINLKPGQLLTTERKLAELCNCKDIDKSLIHRSLNKFLTWGFSNQETIHTKTVITVTHPAICELLNNDLEPRFEPTSNQLRTNFEPEKKNVKNVKNEKKEKYLSDSVEYGLSSFFLIHMKSFISDFKDPNLQRWSASFDFLMRIDGKSYDEVKARIDWLKKESGFWCKTIQSPEGLRKNWDKLTAAMQITPRDLQKSENKKYADKIFNDCKSNSCELKVNCESVSFIPTYGASTEVISLKFGDNDFQDHFRNLLAKNGFRRLKSAVVS